MKKISTIVLIIGITLFIIGFILPLISFVFYTAQNGSVGIIGGADGPTAIYLTSTLLFNKHSVVWLYGVAFIISSLFCLIFEKTLKKSCSIKTSGISLSISAIISLGIYCFFCFISCFIMTHPNKHPIIFPTSIILGILSFVALIILINFYVKARKEKPSVKGIIIDILFVITFLVPFFITYLELHSTVSDLLR